MRRRILVAVVVAIVVAGCSSGGHETPLTSSRCAELETQAKDAVAQAGGTCNGDQDCGLIGGQFGTGTCDCAPYLVDCGGVAIANNAPGRGRALAAIDDFKQAGCVSGMACDCAPALLHCSNHVCTASLRSCLPGPPPDAPGD
jgi:hypothetical protein